MRWLSSVGRAGNMENSTQLEKTEQTLEDSKRAEAQVVE
jgi:hypothetical protein